MIWVMPLQKVGQHPDQNSWSVLTSQERPAHDVGDEIAIPDEPSGFRWRVADLFRDHPERSGATS